MARKKKKTPRLIVSKNAFSRFLQKNYGYTDIRRYPTLPKFSSRLNSIMLAKDSSGNDIFIKICRHADMSENEYIQGLELWKQAPDNFAKPLAYHAGKKFSFCANEYVEGKSFFDLLEEGFVFSTEQKAQIIEDVYNFFCALRNTNIIHRDILWKNMLFSNGRAILVDCQLAIKVDSTNEITYYGDILTLCRRKWEHPLNMSLLEWDDVPALLRLLQSIGPEPEYQQRFDIIQAELQAAVGKLKRIYSYPSMKELDKAMRISKFRSYFHPKSKLRSRYRHITSMLQFFKDNHPDSKKPINS